MQPQDIPFHIRCRPQDVGAYCILPGDPGRCASIAALLDHAVHIAQNREYTLYSGALEGERVTVCSTGIGGPSAAIAMEELYACGAHTFIRTGTCGGIAEKVQAGDVIIATGAVRMEGTSREYAPLPFPAVPDFSVVSSLVDAANHLQYRCHTGIVQSKDSFYGQHAPETMPVAAALLQNWEAWKRLGTLGSEMECAALFTVAAARGLRCGAVLGVLWNQERKKAGLDQKEHLDTAAPVAVAVEAMRRLIIQDKQQ